MLKKFKFIQFNFFSSHPFLSESQVMDHEEQTETKPAAPSFVPTKVPASFPFYPKRYLNRYIIPDCKGITGNNIAVSLHSNNLLVVGLDPSHFAIREFKERREKGEDVSISVSYDVRSSRSGEVKNRQVLASSIQGKKKKNAMRCQEDMTLAIVMVTGPPLSEKTSAQGEDGKETEPPIICRYKIPACVAGAVVEMNPHLVQQGSLVVDNTLTEGYVAIINPDASKATKNLFDGPGEKDEPPPPPSIAWNEPSAGRSGRYIWRPFELVSRALVGTTEAGGGDE